MTKQLTADSDSRYDDDRVEEREHGCEREEQGERLDHSEHDEGESDGTEKGIPRSVDSHEVVSVSVCIGKPNPTDAATGSRNARTPSRRIATLATAASHAARELMSASR